MLKLTDEHRAILCRRTPGLGQIAMPMHCDLLHPWVLVSLGQLCRAGFIEGKGYADIDHPSTGLIRCMVWGLTDAGRKLCTDHDLLPHP